MTTHPTAAPAPAATSAPLGPPPCAPFPYFGGKRRAAPLVWRHLGDPVRYVEPFCGSLAVLWARPATTRPRFELVNDSDGHLVNFWRAVRHAPLEVARLAAGPVIEPDVHACGISLLQDRAEFVDWLAGDLEHYDVRRAGMWLYATLWSIGEALQPGPWVRGPGGGLVEGEPRAGIRRGVPKIASATAGVSWLEAPGTPLEDRAQAMARRLAWFQARLAGVRIICGDWRRAVTPTAIQGNRPEGPAGIFLDPPYVTSGDIYHHDGNDADAAAAVRAWCITEASPAWRIVLAGYEDEHDELLAHGWTKLQGASGSGNGLSIDPLAGRRERLWLSPSCAQVQGSLLDEIAA